MKWKALLKIPALLMMCSVFLAQEPKSNSAYPKREFRHQEKITSEITMKDGLETTYVFLGPALIAASDSERTSIRFDAAFQYDGKAPVKPKHISLSFFNVSPSCKIPLHVDITFLLDGAPLQIRSSFKSWRERKPDEEGVGFGFGEMKGDRCHEFAVVFLSLKNFLRIVSSRDVEVQIDQLKFKLTETNLEALRDLASRMVL